MADEADERSALLQNGHASGETEVKCYLFLLLSSPFLIFLGYKLSPVTGLMANTAGRIHGKRYGESQELVEIQKKYQCCNHCLDGSYEPSSKLNVYPRDWSDRRGLEYHVKYCHRSYNRICCLPRSWSLDPGTILRDIWEKASVHRLFLRLQHLADPDGGEPQHQISNRHPDHIRLFRK